MCIKSIIIKSNLHEPTISHITAQMSDFTRMLVSRRPIQITFAGPNYTNFNLHKILQIVKPTDFMAVPRVYEKWQQLFKLKIASMQESQQQIVDWALEQGKANTDAQQKGDLAPFGFNLANLLVLNRLKKLIGLDQIENLYFGAAPMSHETQNFYTQLNTPVLSLYGLTETAGGTTFHEFPCSRLDRAGGPMPGIRIRIFNPDETGEGEICVRGRNVFMGYLNQEKQTWDVFDAEGYFHTGDKGFIDEQGFLKITGRIKEIVITSGGENVDPAPIELAVRSCCPLISHAVVVGDHRKFVSLLLTLKVKKDEQGQWTDKLTPEVKKFIKKTLKERDVKTVEDAKNNPAVRRFIETSVAKANRQAINQVARVKRWVVLDKEFDVVSGELTPTFKIKRKYIVKKYEQEINQMYQEIEPKL